MCLCQKSQRSKNFITECTASTRMKIDPYLLLRSQALTKSISYPFWKRKTKEYVQLFILLNKKVSKVKLSSLQQDAIANICLNKTRPTFSDERPQQDRENSTESWKNHNQFPGKTHIKVRNYKHKWKICNNNKGPVMCVLKINADQ